MEQTSLNDIIKQCADLSLTANASLFYVTSKSKDIIPMFTLAESRSLIEKFGTDKQTVEKLDIRSIVVLLQDSLSLFHGKLPSIVQANRANPQIMYTKFRQHALDNMIAQTLGVTKNMVHVAYQFTTQDVTRFSESLDDFSSSTNGTSKYHAPPTSSPR